MIIGFANNPYQLFCLLSISELHGKPIKIIFISSKFYTLSQNLKDKILEVYKTDIHYLDEKKGVDNYIGNHLCIKQKDAADSGILWMFTDPFLYSQRYFVNNVAGSKIMLMDSPGIYSAFRFIGVLGIFKYLIGSMLSIYPKIHKFSEAVISTNAIMFKKTFAMSLLRIPYADMHQRLIEKKKAVLIKLFSDELIALRNCVDVAHPRKGNILILLQPFHQDDTDLSIGVLREFYIGLYRKYQNYGYKPYFKNHPRMSKEICLSGFDCIPVETPLEVFSPVIGDLFFAVASVSSTSLMDEIGIVNIHEVPPWKF